MLTQSSFRNFVVMFVGLVLTGCGSAGSPVSKSPVSVAPATQIPSAPLVPQNTQNLLPPLTYAFEVTGSMGNVPSYTFPAVSTDNVLKLTLITNSYGYVENSNQAVAMKCIQYKVTVRPQGSSGGRVVYQKVSLTGSPGVSGTSCDGALPQPSLDFSDLLTQGHGSFEVLVSAYNYDNCRQSGWVGGAGCALNPVYDTHRINGTVQIHINGTL